MIENYRVLARKYRPQTLSDLVGQETIVKTLTQAIKLNKLPHAFILHGIRGVGKTTTARIIAKSLNCLASPDFTTDPCGLCDSCMSISQDRHLDIVEMDAASRTGVDDIREIIEAARYKPITARYKIYIIDEVHMLSKSAFNALLKTLEEPPPHVKFIFATTEIKKIPDTVLSRCMKLDLCRIKNDALLDLFKKVAKEEDISIDNEALIMLIRAADGSARDGLSMFDQAIALSGSHITGESVRNMLGLVDRNRLFQLLDFLFSGQIAQALKELRQLYNLGSDSTSILSELLDITYWISCLKIHALADDQNWPLGDREQGMIIAQKIGMSQLVRAWQILSKGYEEVSRSPLPTQATEMVLIRLCHLGDFPGAADLASLLQSQSSGEAIGSRVNAIAKASTSIDSSMVQSPAIPILENFKNPSSFEEVLSIVASAREPILYSYLIQDIHLVSFKHLQIELRLNNRVPKTLIKELEELLLRTTGEKWQIILSDVKGEATVIEKNKDKKQQIEAESLNHPIVKEIIRAFPEAIASIQIANEAPII